MSQQLYGSLNLTTLLEQAKAGHSAFRRAESNGNIYVNIKQWINDEKDAKGNDSAITLQSTKEKRAEEKKVYVGNLKISEKKEGEGALSQEAPGKLNTELSLDDLPF